MKTTWNFLIADDDADDRELFASILKEQLPDARITCVEDGTQAVAYLQACPEVYLPDALVLDYNMPLMTAPQVLDAICDKPKYYGLAKFILSTSDAQHYIDGCLKKGVIEYFKKPSNIQAIHGVAARIIEHLTTVSNKS